MEEFLRKVTFLILLPLLGACTDVPKSERVLELTVDQRPKITMRAVDKDIPGFTKDNQDLISAFEKVCPGRGADTRKYFADLRDFLAKRFGMQNSVLYSHKSLDGSGNQKIESEIRVSITGESLTCQQLSR